jgi:acyl-CoA reductase-like NAD-dependent aldehyde dehydrogenase
MDVARIKQQLKPCNLYIDGEWITPSSTRTIPVMNPATGEQLTTVPDANADDVDRAVQAARDAFESGRWRLIDFGFWIGGSADLFCGT